MDKLSVSYKFNTININVNFDAGVNVLSSYSGTGKTLLISALDTYCMLSGYKHTLLNYNDTQKATDQLVSQCKDSDIILIDNGDSFDIDGLLKQIRDPDKIIIVALKNTYKIDMTTVREYLVHYENLHVTIEEI